MKITVSHASAVDLAAKWRGDVERAGRVTDAMLRHLGFEHARRAGELAGGGRYGQSFTFRPAGSAVESGSTSPMAAILERGRRPGHRPPVQSIVKRSGGSLEAARRTADRIAVQGTRGQWVVKKANAQLKRDGTFERIAREGLRAIVEG